MVSKNRFQSASILICNDVSFGWPLYWSPWLPENGVFWQPKGCLLGICSFGELVKYHVCQSFGHPYDACLLPFSLFFRSMFNFCVSRFSRAKSLDAASNCWSLKVVRAALCNCAISSTFLLIASRSSFNVSTLKAYPERDAVSLIMHVMDSGWFIHTSRKNPSMESSCEDVGGILERGDHAFISIASCPSILLFCLCGPIALCDGCIACLYPFLAPWYPVGVRGGPNSSLVRTSWISN